MSAIETGVSISQAIDKALTFGGVLKPNSAPTLEADQIESMPFRWNKHIEKSSQFIGRSNCSGSAANNEVAVWICGYATVSKESKHLNAAEYALEQYQSTNSLPLEDLEGSFVIAVHDIRKERIQIYRNIAGAVNLFYSVIGDELRYSTNLAHLLSLLPHSRPIDEKLLPLFFLYRCLPGRETLFQNVMRLLPGDSLVFDSGKVTHSRITTFDDYRGTVSIYADIIEQINDTIGTAVQSCVHAAPYSAILLSGGVDSTLLLSHWHECIGEKTSQPVSYCATLDHPQTVGEFAYAKSAADYFNSTIRPVPIDRPYIDYLDAAIRDTAETPNHVQAAYFPILAHAMHGDGITTGICGEAADGLFGVSTQDEIHLAEMLRKYIPVSHVRSALKLICRRDGRRRGILELSNRMDDSGYLLHPINQQASFAHLESVLQCFGQQAVIDAMEYRYSLIVENGLNKSYLEKLHSANLLTSSINSASYWNTLCETRGIQLLSPFLDSRVIRLAMSIDDETKYQFRRPKHLLKDALSCRTNHELAYRRKLSFGQPIFEWMSKDGQLRGAIEQIDNHDFVDSATLARAKAIPNWFLYNLLCFDRLKKHLRAI